MEELEKCWRSTANGAAGKCIRLDLEGVTFSDQNAKALLVKMFEDGVELRAGGPMMNSLVGEITSRSARSRGKYFVNRLLFAAAISHPPRPVGPVDSKHSPQAFFWARGRG